MADDENVTGGQGDRESMNWTVEQEVALFHALHEHKPIGINRHFKMFLIQDKLNSSTKNKIVAGDIWSHLATLYDLQSLNESERLPFPNSEVEFNLPDAVPYRDLKEQLFPRRIPSVRSTSLDDSSLSSSSKELINNTSTSLDISDPFRMTCTPPGGTSTDQINDNSSTDKARNDKQRKRTRQSIVDVPAPSVSLHASQVTATGTLSTSADITVATPTSAKRSRRV